ncbi:InlB B-repeat-containing protein, partial [Fibrobacter sp.]|uniref:InlB B-repeat-containing protein n=1 Tax=Fibrobacter sp. TaxID=35828 RepID=UPI00388FC70B
MKRPLSFYKLVMAAAVALPSMALADITPVAPQLDPTDNCYMIGTAAELYGFAAMVNDEGKRNVCGKLTDDIVVNENVLENASGASCVKKDGSYNTSTCPPGTLHAWTPIGAGGGTFYGQGHTISGLFFNGGKNEDAGLFGITSGKVVIDGVGLVDSYFKADFAGGFVSNAQGEVYIRNSFNLGYVNGIEYGGGFFGSAEPNDSRVYVYNSYNAGSVNMVGTLGTALAGYCEGCYINGFYYLAGSSVGDYGESKTAEQFDDGTVAELLHDWCEKDGDDCKEGGLNGSVWGQGLGRDNFPTFLGVIGPALTLHVYEGVEIDSAYTPDTDLPTPPTREGYEFLGWYATSDFSGSAVTRIPSDATGEQEFFAKWEAQSGSGCIKIATADDLYNFAARVNDGDGEICGELTADITVNEHVLKNASGESCVKENGAYDTETCSEALREWTPIGEKATFTHPFMGTFHGNGHTISGLYVNPLAYNKMTYKGLFGYVGGNVTIDGVGIVDSYIYGSNYVGGLVGGLNVGTTLTISNSFNAGFVCGATTDLGGLVGGVYLSQQVLNNPPTVEINNSYNFGSVVGNNNVGGLVGRVLALTINNSYNMGLVSSSSGSGDDLVGGYLLIKLLPTVTNSFCIGESQFEGNGATRKTAEEFANGTVALLLHDWCEKDGEVCKEGGLNGSVWGQDFTKENSLPDLGGEFVGGTPRTLTLHTFEGDTRVYPTAYFEGLGLELPTDLTREGFIFLGWYASSDFSGSVETRIPNDATGEQEFFAKWEALGESGCIEIATADDLYNFAELVQAKTIVGGEICGKLTADITVNEGLLD